MWICLSERWEQRNGKEISVTGNNKISSFAYSFYVGISLLKLITEILVKIVSLRYARARGFEGRRLGLRLVHVSLFLCFYFYLQTFFEKANPSMSRGNEELCSIE